jgi:adenylate cyclase
VAEVELQSEDQVFERPAWLGEEVSHDRRYANANLLKQPYRSWAK